MQHLLVTRRQCHQGRCALRVVDVIGPEEGLAEALVGLFEAAMTPQDEYMDLVCHGIDAMRLARAGMAAVDFDRDDVIVPNYFEPFEQRNVPVYCVADPVPEGVIYRQCKADGDQDRPNLPEAGA